MNVHDLSAVGVVGGGIPEPAGGERRHVPLYGRLVAEEQLAGMGAPSDIQVRRAFRHCGTVPGGKVNGSRWTRRWER